jgi:hypothetical protein
MTRHHFVIPRLVGDDTCRRTLTSILLPTHIPWEIEPHATELPKHLIPENHITYYSSTLTSRATLKSLIGWMVCILCYSCSLILPLKNSLPFPLLFRWPQSFVFCNQVSICKCKTISMLLHLLQYRVANFRLFWSGNGWNKAVNGMIIKMLTMYTEKCCY